MCGIIMEHLDPFTKSARECLALARTTKQPDTRVELLTMAQTFLHMANETAVASKVLDSVVRGFNDQQMVRQ